MRTLLLLLGLVFVASATHYKFKITDKGFLQKQKDILRLFKHVNQHSHYKDHVEIGKEWDIEAKTDLYVNSTAVKEFLHWYHKDTKNFLARDEIFTIFNHWHRKMAVCLYDLFHYAKDYDTFYKTAVWARQHMNQGMFLYTFSVAVVHRPDTQGIILPPIYEVYPYYFFTSDVIHKAYHKKMHYGGVSESPDHASYYIHANYTGHYTHSSPDQELTYFTEDVGLNAFYYYYNLYYPFWMSKEKYHFDQEYRGEMYFYVHHQLLARYYMERLSHHVGSIDWFDYNDYFEDSYYPMMMYPNGIEFPARPEHAYMYHHKFYNGHNFDGDHTYWKAVEIKDYERRIRDAIDHGFVMTEDGKKIDLYDSHGFDMLANLIAHNKDTVNGKFYGALDMFARQFLGYGYKPYTYHRTQPSVLEHYETSLRDPAFYMFYKRIFTYFMMYKDHLHPYTHTELTMPGVKVENVWMDKLTTYFEDFHVDISNAVTMSKHEYENVDLPIYAKMERLSHKPFTYKVFVESEHAGPVVVRTYIGPKYDEFGHHLWLDDNRMNFVEFDHFVHTLQPGKNVIERHSREFPGFGADKTSFKTLYKNVMGALKGDQEFHVDSSDTYWNFPNRMVLPRGKPSGMHFQVFVFVSPYKPAHTSKVDPTVYPHPMDWTNSWLKVDAHPYMYPLDRHIVEQDFHTVPNSYWLDVTIFHKTAEEMNKSHDHEHH